MKEKELKVDEIKALKKWLSPAYGRYTCNPVPKSADYMLDTLEDWFDEHPDAEIFSIQYVDKTNSYKVSYRE